jgi:hypothetical protein
MHAGTAAAAADGGLAAARPQRDGENKATNMNCSVRLNWKEAQQ